ncbi:MULTISPECIES: AAA family ATPase [unclassified Paenibacillus]|uniref:AAA family ATPase n=1 Tax=unclassified Paenibacillus TaxID=185978 RepID=UPI00070B00AF|nr:MULTISPECIES: AAA family ATPase [unclassified Paenibacillus]KQX65904.1 serine protease [Paenibacillus sp. Root444D2]KRE48874.1 serine protease [Paenibacillus sp. Soil724D2]
MVKPLLIIVNGLPGTGKTTLAKRLAAEMRFPLFSRDGIYETLFDALDCQNNGCPPLIGPSTFTLLYAYANSLLKVGQSLVIEGFFGRPELRSAEFLQLKLTSDFQPFQILCKTDGEVLLDRFLKRMSTVERHIGHHDQEWIEEEQNKERLLQGHLTPLSLGGTVVEIDTTTPYSFDYDELLKQVRAVQFNM